MNNDPLSGALAKSLQDERAAVDKRFERAESVLGGQGNHGRGRHAQPRAPKRSRSSATPSLSLILITLCFPSCRTRY